MVDGARVFLLRTTMRDNRACAAVSSNVGATHCMLHTHLSFLRPQEQTRGHCTMAFCCTVKRSSVLVVNRPEVPCSLLRTAHVRVFSRLPERSSCREIETPVSNKQSTREITVLFVLVLSSNLVERCLRFEQGRAQTLVGPLISSQKKNLTDIKTDDTLLKAG